MTFRSSTQRGSMALAIACAALCVQPAAATVPSHPPVAPSVLAPVGNTPNVTGEWQLIKTDHPNGHMTLGTVRMYTSQQKMFLEVMTLNDEIPYAWDAMAGGHIYVKDVKAKLLQLAGVYHMASDGGEDVLSSYAQLQPKFMTAGLGLNPTWMPLSIEGRVWGQNTNMRVERIGGSLADVAASAGSSIGSLIGTWTVAGRDVEVFQGISTAMVIWDGSDLHELDKVGGSDVNFSGKARRGGQASALTVAHANEMTLAFGSAQLKMIRNGGAPPPGSAASGTQPAPAGGGAPGGAWTGAPGDTPLHTAVRSKDDKLVGTIISAKQAPIDALSATGQTALHEAVLVGDDLILEQILAGGANINAVNSKGQTPVGLALQLDKMALAKLLLKRGAEVKAETAAVEKAVQSNNTEVLDLLLKAGADANVAVNKAVETGNLILFEKIVNENSVAVSNALFQKALDSKKYPIAENILGRGIDNNAALAYCIQRNEKNMVLTVLGSGNVNSDPAMDYAVRGNDQAMAGAIIDNYQGNANNGLGVAVETNNVMMSKFLLDKGADPSMQMANAARKGLDPIVTAMLDKNGSADQGLGAAVEGKQMTTIRLLVERGAGPNPAVPLVAEQGDLPLMELLLSKRADPEPGMPIAVRKGNAPMADMLIVAGANGANPEYMRSSAGAGDVSMINVLLTRGKADPQEGMLPAIQAHKNEIVFLLMDRGASGNRPGYLAAAAVHNDVGLTGKLIDAGCEPSEALEPAVNAGAGAVVDQLVGKGVDVKNIRYLVTAVGKNYVEVVAALLKGGAEPLGYSDPSTGWTLLHTASKNGNDAIIKLLLDKRLDVNAVAGGTGETPLLLAVQEGNKHLPAVMALVEAGANVNAMNSKGKSVFQETPSGLGGGGKVRDYLKEKGAEKKPGK